jgi:hypothetical protein
MTTHQCLPARVKAVMSELAAQTAGKPPHLLIEEARCCPRRLECELGSACERIHLAFAQNWFQAML